MTNYKHFNLNCFRRKLIFRDPREEKVVCEEAFLGHRKLSVFDDFSQEVLFKNVTAKNDE